MRQVIFAGAALSLTACSLMGEIELNGTFAGAPAPSEIRYTPHPGYGLSAMDVAFLGKEKALNAEPFRSIFPDASGAFTTGAEKVVYHSPPLEAPKPAYWLSFSNEKEVLYGMAETKTGFDYRTTDLTGTTTLDRARACWLIKSGEFIYPPDDKGRHVILKIAIEPNPDSSKPCTEVRR